MRVLVACEFSGVVRRAFRARGHEAWSCDILPAEDDGEHIQDDVLDRLEGWDLIIAHPPCTELCVSGARWWKTKGPEKLMAAEDFFMRFVERTTKVCIENPIGRMSTIYRKPDQIIQPWQFGHGEIKATCLWLEGLPLLKPTAIVEGRKPVIHHMSPGPNRGKERSRTYEGIAAAMAEQWG